MSRKADNSDADEFQPVIFGFLGGIATTGIMIPHEPWQSTWSDGFLFGFCLLVVIFLLFLSAYVQMHLKNQRLTKQLASTNAGQALPIRNVLMFRMLTAIAGITHIALPIALPIAACFSICSLYYNHVDKRPHQLAKAISTYESTQELGALRHVASSSSHLSRCVAKYLISRRESPLHSQIKEIGKKSIVIASTARPTASNYRLSDSLAFSELLQAGNLRRALEYSSIDESLEDLELFCRGIRAVAVELAKNETVVGTYSTGIPARRIRSTIAIVDPIQGIVTAVINVDGPQPTSLRVRRGVVVEGQNASPPDYRTVYDAFLKLPQIRESTN